MEPPAAFDPANLVFEGVDFGKQQWHKVVDFPPGATVAVLDLGNGADAENFKNDKYSIGRYDENRSIYTTDLFTTPEGPRCVHVGIDLGAPVGTPVYACADGIISSCGYGHLDAQTSIDADVGKVVKKGDVIGRMGQ
eukprot:gene14390-6222_t